MYASSYLSTHSYSAREANNPEIETCAILRHFGFCSRVSASDDIYGSYFIYQTRVNVSCS